MIEYSANCHVWCDYAGGHLCPVFLKVEWPDRSCRPLVCKQVCSALFLVVGLCAVFYVKNDSVYVWLVLGALFCSFPGDALLHYEAIVQKDVFFSTE